MQQVAYAEFWFIFVLRERKPDGRKRRFFRLILQKRKYLFLLWMYTNKSKPFTIPIIFMTKRSRDATIPFFQIRSDPIQKILSIADSDPILAQFIFLFFLINVEFLYFCVMRFVI